MEVKIRSFLAISHKPLAMSHQPYSTLYSLSSLFSLYPCLPKSLLLSLLCLLLHPPLLDTVAISRNSILMQANIRRFIALFVLTLSLTACGKQQITISSYDGKEQVFMTVEVADSVKERSRGLMHRTSLTDGQGMLFVYPEASMLNFWMKDTLIPLEILFFDASGSFVSAATMEPCTADPCTRYPSQAASQFALEAAPGFREKHKIGVGWKLSPAEIMKVASPR